MGTMKQLLLTPSLALLCGLLGSGCSSGAYSAGRGASLGQSIAVDCKPGDSSVVCCIKKFPTTAAASCGASAGEVAGVLNGLRVLNEAATAADEEDADDFANNADLPEWKQRCIRNYVNCQDEGWTGICIYCLPYCEGQQEWPLRKCRPRKKEE
jgi:hypothetical protein